MNLRMLLHLALAAMLVACGDDDGQANQNNQNGPECSNGVVDTGEQCDDGAANSDTVPDACRTDCTLARCGDGVTDTGEGCDEGAANSDVTPDACRESCVAAGCGDGVVDSGEGCDDGNLEAGDGCGADCQAEQSVCGNEVAETGEACDVADLRDATCESLGLGPGTLACAVECTYDTTGCCGAIGSTCTDTCPSPLVCQSGLCLPAERPICGGFAGAQCPVDLPACLYWAGADAGPCFTAAEASCICARPDAQTYFPTCP